MFVTKEKEARMFIMFLLSPQFYARVDWVRPDHESSDQPA